MSVAGCTELRKEPFKSSNIAEPRTSGEEEYEPNPWKDATPEEWDDWRWQLKHRVTRAEQLKLILNLSQEEIEAIEASKGRLATAITPYFAKLMDRQDSNCPIRRQAIPTLNEFHLSPADLLDPCAEDENSPVPHLVHRYPDRVLLLVTDKCAVYCRYCTRRRMVGESEKSITAEELDQALAYIQSTKKIRDVLISGGDPLLLEDEVLDGILAKIHKIPHVEVIRIGTRVPVTLPQRITPVPDGGPQEISSALDEHPFHPPQGDHQGSAPLLRPAVRCRNPPRKPDRFAAGNQRPSRGHETAHA